MPKVQSKDYWINRAEQRLIGNEKTALEYEKLLKGSYNKAIANIQKEVEAYYGRYAKENGVTLAEARQQLNTKEFLNFKQASEAYLKEIEKYDPTTSTEEYKKYLKKLSGKAYITRMDELVANIRHHIEVNNASYEDGFSDVLKKGYEDSYYKTMFDIQKQTGFGIDFAAPGATKLDTAVHEKWQRSDFSSRIWDDKQKLLRNLEQIVSQAFVTNRGIRELSNTLADKMGVSYNNAKRLIRTEMNYISNKATMASYADSGVVKEYEFVATLDNRTSEICSELDGKIISIKEAQAGVNMPPMHPYCRSVTIPHFPDDEISEAVTNRVARNAKGKSYNVGEDVTFEKWTTEHADGAYARRVKKNPQQYEQTNEATAAPPKITLKDKVEAIKAQLALTTDDNEREALIKEAGRLVEEDLKAEREPILDEIKVLEEQRAALEKELNIEDIKWDNTVIALDKTNSSAEMNKLLRTVKLEYGADIGEVRRQLKEKLDDPKLMELNRKIRGLHGKYSGDDESNPSMMKAKLAEIRPIGNTKGHDYDDHMMHSKSKVRKAIKEAYEGYPADWVDASVKHSIIRISKTSRGHYNHTFSEVAISGDYEEDQYETAVHELGHRFERVVPNILKLEKWFYLRRTLGEPLEWLGSNYAKGEKTRKDNFIHPYMGKDYNDTVYELLSMGFQYAYTNPTTLWKDTDYSHWVYGILATQ